VHEYPCKHFGERSYKNRLKPSLKTLKRCSFLPLPHVAKQRKISYCSVNNSRRVTATNIRNPRHGSNLSPGHNYTNNSTLETKFAILKRKLTSLTRPSWHTGQRPSPQWQYLNCIHKLTPNIIYAYANFFTL